ncbi:MAG: DUF4203 domain-containing protein [Eubacteriales bacterium]|nr:DUF4203 domain-containing protein [Eubacteriales bacterium]
MTDILTRIMNIAERVRAMQDLSAVATGVFGIILIFGALSCLLGYRLLRFWMMLGGFALGAGGGFALVYSSGTEEKTIYLAAMAALGILVAVIAFMIYKAGVFILGAAIGMALSIYVLHPTTSFAFFVCILVGVGLGTLGVNFAREVIIVGTSLQGGLMAGYSLAKLGGMDEIPYGIGMGAGFAILGMLIQFATNRPKDDEEEDETEDSLSEEYNVDDEAIEEEYIEELIQQDEREAARRKRKKQMLERRLLHRKNQSRKIKSSSSDGKGPGTGTKPANPYVKSVNTNTKNTNSRTKSASPYVNSQNPNKKK